MMFIALILTLAGTASLADTSTVPLTDLFVQLDARLPHGDYRIPSLVATPKGTLLAFVMGRFHRTDNTPNIVYLRRSLDDGATWGEAQAILNDPTNHTMFGGAPVVDPKDGSITFVHNQAVYGSHDPCSGCHLWGMKSTDEGATWSKPQPLNVSAPANATWGGALASGIALTRGAHAGRMMVALRHDCGCHDVRASFVVYSDDHGATWTGGAELVLLPQYGGGWTECQVAELTNGSVLLTSRNFYGTSSGYGPRLFARSDDGGATWAANWSASAASLPDPYCEGSLLSEPARLPKTMLFANPSHAGPHRLNFSVHASKDGGLSWPYHSVVFPGDSAYSDMALTRNGSVAVLFEKGGGGNPYLSVAFGVLPVPTGPAARFPVPTGPAARFPVPTGPAARFPVMQLPPLAVEMPSAEDLAAVALSVNNSFEFVLAHPECVSAVRDQGQCGSCWAFAATGALADRTCIRTTGKPTRLSPQDLLDCETLNLGCTLGSLPEMAWSFLRKTGVADDDCVPYDTPDPKKHKCPRTCANGQPKRPAHVHQAVNVTHLKGVAAIMAAVLEGPVDVTFNVHKDFEEHWASEDASNETYVHTHGGFTGIHSVKLVGYGVDHAGVPYWTCENSWGCSGGLGFADSPVRCERPYTHKLAGYFRIRRGTNECGIESLAYAGWPAVGDK